MLGLTAVCVSFTKNFFKGEKADMQLYQQSNLFNTSGNSIKSETAPTSKILTPHVGNINSVNVSASGQSLDVCFLFV